MLKITYRGAADLRMGDSVRGVAGCGPIQAYMLR